MQTPANTSSASQRPPVRIGLALGGGFARGIAHAGVLRALQQHCIPIHCVTGVSAGAIAAAAYASGATPDEIVRAGCSLRPGDVGQWRPGRQGLVENQCMTRFLARLLKTDRFEQMTMPLGVGATDFHTGHPVSFFGRGSVFEPLRASCAFPGLFQPVRHAGRLLVDGAMSTRIPAALARRLGATHVISVVLPAPARQGLTGSALGIVTRRFRNLRRQGDDEYLRDSNLVITPDIGEVDWYAFGRGPALVQAGEEAALAALPLIQSWLEPLRDPSVLRVA